MYKLFDYNIKFYNLNNTLLFAINSVIYVDITSEKNRREVNPRDHHISLNSRSLVVHVTLNVSHLSWQK